MLINAKITKWGNSLGLRINKDIAHLLAIENGSSVTLMVDEAQTSLIVQPVIKKEKKYIFFKEAELINSLSKKDFQEELLASPLLIETEN